MTISRCLYASRVMSRILFQDHISVVGIHKWCRKQNWHINVLLKEWILTNFRVLWWHHLSGESMEPCTLRIPSVFYVEWCRASFNLKDWGHLLAKKSTAGYCPGEDISIAAKATFFILKHLGAILKNKTSASNWELIFIDCLEGFF